MTKSTNTTTMLVNQNEYVQGFENIIAFLDKLKLFETIIKVSSATGAEKIPAHLALVNSFNQELVLRPLNKQNEFPNFSGSAVLIENEAGNISFLSKKGSLCRSHYLNIKVPSNITIINLRKNARIDFSNQNIKVEFINHKVNDFKMETQKLLAQLVDISAGGIALKSINSTLGHLRKNDRLTITSINEIPLDSTLTATIAHIKNIQCALLTSGCFQIGIKFNSEINLNEFLKKVNLI